MKPITIVVPTYNEAENLHQLAEALWALPTDPIHLLIVDDASPDGTGDLAEQLSSGNPGCLSVIHRAGKLGLGTAYITGFKHAIRQGFDRIGQMDADFSHSPSYIPQFVEALADCDCVVGSRYIEGGKLDERWGIGRVWLSAFGNFYARSILGMQLRDVTGGFRLWRSSTLSSMPLDNIRSNGYVFQVEMAYVAARLGFKLRELPIYFEDRRIGQSKMNFRIQLEAALRVWQVLWLHRKLTPQDRVQDQA